MSIPLSLLQFFLIYPALYNFSQKCCLFYLYLSSSSLFSLRVSLHQYQFLYFNFLFSNTRYQTYSFAVAIILSEIILFQTNAHYYFSNHVLSFLILPTQFSKRIYCLLNSSLFALNLHIYYSILHCSIIILQTFSFMSHLQ